MVSPLWKACAEGNLDRVSEILAEESVDIEIKDHTGVTPLISAIQAGHVEIVRVLLDKGADPHNGSSQGPPEQYTSDPAIIDLITSAKNKVYPVPQLYPGYSNDPQADAARQYYPPPGAYYYPGMPPPMMHQGPVPYYPPPVMDPSGNGYYPACRYGASCMFSHPDHQPSLNGPMPPPAQYPAPYDQGGPAPFPSYYPPPPPPSYPPYGVPPMNPTSPTAPPSHPAHAHQGSEVISPVQAFSPNGIPPPPGPYGVVSPVSPVYAHSGPVPVHLTMPPPPPGHLQTGPQSPQHMYQPTSPTASRAMPPQPYGVPYPPQGHIPNGNMDGVISPKPVSAQPMDGYNPIHRDPMTHHRRGSARRLSLGGRGKPPCLFFPSGRCRNGDDCRFPHVLPDAPLPHHQGPPFGGRGGHRPRPSQHHVNGLGAIEDKLATMNIQEDGQQRGVNGNATENSSRSQSTDPGTRPRSYSGFKPNHFTNGHRPERRVVAPRPQRVPSADEFPVLGGTSTPPLRSPGANGILVNGHNGPTAAQILQAPPPARKDKDTQPGTPNSDRSQPLAKEEKPEPNGAPVTQQEPVATKLPVSFAAAAATAAVTDVPKEISVTA